MATVAIKHIDTTNPGWLYERYPGATNRQPVHIALDLETGDLTADINPDIVAGTGEPRPLSVVNGLARWYEIATLTAEAANDLIDDLAPLAQRVIDDTTIREGSDGYDHGHPGPDATAAEEQIARICEQWGADPANCVEMWDAGELTRQDAEKYGLTADSTDDDLTQISAAIERDVQANSDAGYLIFIDIDLDKFRDDLRDEATERHEEEIAEAKRVLNSTRLAAITRMHGWGWSNRDIAPYVGVSFETVRKILRAANGLPTID